MAQRVLCIVADGVEETELVAPVDMLRRAEVEVVLASPSGASFVTGKNGIQLGAEVALAEIAPASFDALLLPGGPAVMDLRAGGAIATLAAEFARNEKLIAAICAAPLLLQDAGLLDGRRYTAHSSTYTELTRALADERVVVDGQLITSRGAGTAVEFGLAIVEVLEGADVARGVAEAIMA